MAYHLTLLLLLNYHIFHYQSNILHKRRWDHALENIQNLSIVTVEVGLHLDRKSMPFLISSPESDSHCKKFNFTVSMKRTMCAAMQVWNLLQDIVYMHTYVCQ